MCVCVCMCVLLCIYIYDCECTIVCVCVCVNSKKWTFQNYILIFVFSINMYSTHEIKLNTHDYRLLYPLHLLVPFPPTTLATYYINAALHWRFTPSSVRSKVMSTPLFSLYLLSKGPSKECCRIVVALIVYLLFYTVFHGNKAAISGNHICHADMKCMALPMNSPARGHTRTDVKASCKRRDGDGIACRTRPVAQNPSILLPLKRQWR